MGAWDAETTIVGGQRAPLPCSVSNTIVHRCQVHTVACGTGSAPQVLDQSVRLRSVGSIARVVRHMRARWDLGIAGERDECLQRVAIIGWCLGLFEHAHGFASASLNSTRPRTRAYRVRSGSASAARRSSRRTIRSFEPYQGQPSACSAPASVGQRQSLCAAGLAIGIRPRRR